MQEKVVKSMEEAQQVDNALVYDIDQGVEYIEEFNRKTVRFEKEFHKLGKKQKGKDPEKQKKLVLKFVKEKLYPFWKTEVEDKFWNHGEMEYLPKDTIYTYVFGAFVTGHSKGLQKHMHTAFANILKEMTDRAIAAKQNKDYQEMRIKAIQENIENMTPEQRELLEKSIKANTNVTIPLNNQDFKGN